MYLRESVAILPNFEFLTSMKQERVLTELPCPQIKKKQSQNSL